MYAGNFFVNNLYKYFLLDLIYDIIEKKKADVIFAFEGESFATLADKE